jgi:AraC-like DNA-binding protein
LRDEGTSYQELLDRVRLQLSVRHLSQGKAIAVVATLVGFSQASTFHRAFKSWTGETPTVYQQKLGNRGPSAIPPEHRRNGRSGAQTEPQ